MLFRPRRAAYSAASPLTDGRQMSSVPSPATAAPVVDFFHDVVCGWCFVLAPRLQQVSAELGIQVRHRSFVLQDSRAQMVEVFGSMERAKAIILRHWTDCAAHEDTARIDIEGMRAQDFEYPSGWLGALACQAAGMLGGNDAHGAMFDAVQWAHLHQHRNIGDAEVLLDIAESLGHPRGAFADHMRSDAVRQRVQADRAEAAALGIRSIPTVIGGNGLRLQTLPLPHLRQANIRLPFAVTQHQRFMRQNIHKPRNAAAVMPQRPNRQWLKQLPADTCHLQSCLQITLHLRPVQYRQLVRKANPLP